jgi:hypothetical protein
MKGNLIPLIMVIIFLIIGTMCLFWPEKIQDYALKWAGQGLGKFNPFLDWMKTRSYIWALRIIGVLAIGASLIALFVVIKTQK